MTTFQEALANVRDALERMLTCCIGCEVLVKEGPRTYAKTVDLDEQGKCLRCGRGRA